MNMWISRDYGNISRDSGFVPQLIGEGQFLRYVLQVPL